MFAPHLSNVRPTAIDAQGVRFDSEALLGFTIPPGGFVGFTDPVSARIDDVPTGYGVGSLDLPVELAGMTYSVSGTCYARTPQELNQYGAALRRLGRDRRSFPVIVKHAGEQFRVNAYRGASHRFEEHPGLLRAQYSFDFWCPDPRKYGEMREFVSTGSNVTAWHRGDFDAWGRFTVTNNTSGYRILSNGLAFTVNGSRSSSAVDEIDFSTGSITRDGVPLTRAVTSRRTWPVRPGVDTIWRAEPLGSGGVRAVLRVDDTSI